MYAWESAGELDKETEEDKMLRLSSRRTIITKDDTGIFNPSVESEVSDSDL